MTNPNARPLFPYPAVWQD